MSVEGTVRFRSFAPGQIAAIDEVHEFELKAIGCKWWIRMILPTDSGTNYRIVSFDGRTLYSLTSMKIPGKTEGQGDGENFGLNDCLASVHRMPVPRILTTHAAAPVWLAYLSGCYLERQTNGVAEPPYAFSDSRETFSVLSELPYRYESAWTGSQRWFPSTVVYYDELRPGPKSQETNAYFRVLSSDTANRVAIATNAILDIFSIEQPGRPKRILYTYEVNAISYSLGGEITIPAPNIPGRALVSDARFARDSNGVGTLQYMKKGGYPSDEEVRGMPDFAEQVARDQRHPTDDKARSSTSAPVPSRRWNPFLVFLTGTLAVGCLLLMVSKRTKQKAK